MQNWYEDTAPSGGGEAGCCNSETSHILNQEINFARLLMLD